MVSLAGAPGAYFAAILSFDSVTAIKGAFASDCGRACAADRGVLVPDEQDVQIFLFDTRSA